MVRQVEILLPAFNRGFHLIDHIILRQLPELPAAGILHLFIRHTSAGLMINENADPTVRLDFETVFNRLVPDDYTGYVHTIEGSDDMPAHIKSSLTGHSVVLPVKHGRMHLGTWQGIYLCEFRNQAAGRRITATIFS